LAHTHPSHTGELSVLFSPPASWCFFFGFIQFRYSLTASDQPATSETDSSSKLIQEIVCCTAAAATELNCMVHVLSPNLLECILRSRHVNQWTKSLKSLYKKKKPMKHGTSVRQNQLGDWLPGNSARVSAEIRPIMLQFNQDPLFPFMSLPIHFQ